MNLIRSLRMAGLAEGISFLVLLLIAMPLKYWAGDPTAVLYTGWAHGFLFILYNGLATAAWLRKGWHVTLAYIVGFFVLFFVWGWQPSSSRLHQEPAITCTVENCKAKKVAIALQNGKAPAKQEAKNK